MYFSAARTLTREDHKVDEKYFLSGLTKEISGIKQVRSVLNSFCGPRKAAAASLLSWVSSVSLTQISGLLVNISSLGK